MLRKIIVAVMMAMPIGVLAIETVSSEAPSKQFLGQELVTGLIKTRIAEDQSLAFNVVRQGLADFPDEVVAIVISAMQTGASTIDIASQCDTDIPARIIPSLVYAAISQGADPDLMIARCLCAVPIDQAHVVFMAAMQNIDATQAEGLLATAMQAFEDCDSADCARPSAEAHVDLSTTQADSPLTASEQSFNQERILALIKTKIAKDQSLAFEVVRQGLADFPDQVTPIVISAMQAGASTIDIASQCDTDIPTRIIPDLVSAAISQDADPELIVARCQIDIASQCDTDIPATVISNSITGAIPISNSITEAIPQDVDPEPRIAGCQCASAFDQTLNMLVEAMKNAESIQLKALLLDITINMIPRNGTTTVFDGYLSTLLLAGMQGDSSPQIDRLLDVAIQTFEGNGIDGSAILVNTLVEGDFLSVSNTTEDCIAECTRPLAQSLVIQKTQPPSSSVTVQPDPTDLSADESSASGS